MECFAIIVAPGHYRVVHRPDCPDALYWRAVQEILRESYGFMLCLN